MSNFWDFSVWGGLNLIATLLASLLLANLLKKTIPVLQKLLIPTSVMGGGILLIVVWIYKLCTGEDFFETPFFGGNGTANLELITYHTLALGFIASTFKSTGGKPTKKRTEEIFNTGVTTVSTYLLQAVVGFGITIIAAFVMKDFFAAAGVLLPFGYGQGSGQALNYGNIYETDFGFAGGKSFGLTIAALGFLSASVGGVIYLNFLKRKKKLSDIVQQAEEQPGKTGKEEMPMQASIDKMTTQIALIAISYLVAYAIMRILGSILPGMRSVIYGFNFLLGVLACTLVKAVLNVLKKAGIARKNYVDSFLMTRASNFFYDIMVVSGIAAIRLSALEQYWGIMLILGVAGLVITFVYNYVVAHTLFKDYAEEQFLAMYGMLTGTASTGIILLREADGEFKTPVADNLVYQNFPAIVFGFPLMLLATLAPRKPLLTLGILAAFFLVMNVILFRSKLFRRKKAKSEVK